MIRIRGRARVSTEPKTCKSYVRRVVLKYFMNWAGSSHMVRNVHLVPVMHRYHASGQKGKACVIEVIPEHVEWLSVL